MRIFQSAVFRAVCAIAIGILLIKFPDNTVKGITIAIGILFLLSGLISCLGYYNAKKHVSEYKIFDAQGRQITGEKPTFPIVGIGSMILGLILALSPTAFVSALMYIIGIILLLGAINQFMSLLSARRYGDVPFWFWIAPSAILLVGLYVMLKPMAPLNLAMLVLGWCTLFYGVAELINAIKIHAIRKRVEREQKEELPEIVELIEDDEEPATTV